MQIAGGLSVQGTFYVWAIAGDGSSRPSASRYWQFSWSNLYGLLITKYEYAQCTNSVFAIQQAPPLNVTVLIPRGAHRVRWLRRYPLTASSIDERGQIALVRVGDGPRGPGRMRHKPAPFLILTFVGIAPGCPDLMPVIVSENQLAFTPTGSTNPPPSPPVPPYQRKRRLMTDSERSIGYFIARAEGQKGTLQTPRGLSRLRRPTRTPHPLPTHWESSSLLVSTATVPQFGRAARGHLRWPHTTLSSSELSPPPRGRRRGCGKVRETTCEESIDTYIHLYRYRCGHSEEGGPYHDRDADPGCTRQSATRDW